MRDIFSQNMVTSLLVVGKLPRCPSSPRNWLGPTREQYLRPWNLRITWVFQALSPSYSKLDEKGMLVYWCSQHCSCSPGLANHGLCLQFFTAISKANIANQIFSTQNRCRFRILLNTSLSLFTRKWVLAWGKRTLPPLVLEDLPRGLQAAGITLKSKVGFGSAAGAYWRGGVGADVAFIK